MRSFKLDGRRVLDSLNKPQIEAFEAEAIAILRDPPQWVHRPAIDLQTAVFALLLREDRIDRDLRVLAKGEARKTADELRQRIVEDQTEREEFVPFALSRVARAYADPQRSIQSPFGEPWTDARLASLRVDVSDESLSQLEVRALALETAQQIQEVRSWWSRLNGAPEAEDEEQAVIRISEARLRVGAPLAKARTKRDTEALLAAQRAKRAREEAAWKAEARYVQESERLRLEAVEALEAADLVPMDQVVFSRRPA